MWSSRKVFQGHWKVENAELRGCSDVYASEN